MRSNRSSFDPQVAADLRRKAMERRVADAEKAYAICREAFITNLHQGSTTNNVSPHTPNRAYSAVLQGWLSIDDFAKGIPADVMV